MIYYNVKWDILKVASTAVNKDLADVSSTKEALDRRMAALQEDWKGESADYLNMKVTEAKESEQIVENTLKELAKQLNDVGIIYETAEKKALAADESLPIEGVFKN